MNIESVIKEILKNTKDVDRKVIEITKFMNWNKEKLAASIYKHGTSRDEQRNEIIKDFWGESKR